MPTAYIIDSYLFNILQSGVVYFAGADLDHLGHIVNKDLAITDMAGVQNLGGGVDDLVYRDLADNNFNLDLGNQGCVDLSTTVFLAAALLRPQPITWVTVMPVTPTAFMAAFKASNLASCTIITTLCMPESQLSGQRFFLDDLDGGIDFGFSWPW